MSSIKQRVNKKHRKKSSQVHKRSVVLVLSVLLLLVLVVSVGSNSLRVKNKAYKKQEQLLQEQLDAEAQREEDIDEFEEYVKTDEYIEDKAKEKLGLAYSNETLFKAE